MSRVNLIAAVAGLILATAVTVAEAEKPPSAPAPAVLAGIDTTAIVTADAQRTALGVEIAAALAAEKGRVTELQVLFDAATDEAAALAIQRDIERVKFETEMEILRIQARHARAAGMVREAEQIEAAARQLAEPQPVGQPMPRPAPAERTDAGSR